MPEKESTNQGEQDLSPGQNDDDLIDSELIPELPEEPLLDVETDLRQSLAQTEVEPSKKREEVEMANLNINDDLTNEMPEPSPDPDIWVDEEHEGESPTSSESEPPREPGPSAPPPPTSTTPPIESDIPDSEERTWAMLAHLSILLNLVSGFLGPVAAFIIYLVYKDKSRYVAYQSLQAFVFQLIWWVGAGAVIAVMWVFVGLLSAILIGLCLIPFAILISLVPLAALVYGVVGGIQTNQGDDFRYWLIGDWLRGTLTGS